MSSKSELNENCEENLEKEKMFVHKNEELGKEETDESEKHGKEKKISVNKQDEVWKEKKDEFEKEEKISVNKKDEVGKEKKDGNEEESESTDDEDKENSLNSLTSLSQELKGGGEKISSNEESEKMKKNDLEEEEKNEVEEEPECGSLVDSVDQVSDEEGLRILHEMFTRGKITEKQYTDFMRKFQYLYAYYKVCIGQQDNWKNQMISLNDKLKREVARGRRSSQAVTEALPAEEIDENIEIQLQDLQDKNIEELNAIYRVYRKRAQDCEAEMNAENMKIVQLQQDKHRLNAFIRDLSRMDRNLMLSPETIEREIKELRREVTNNSQELKLISNEVQVTRKMNVLGNEKIDKKKTKLNQIENDLNRIRPVVEESSRESDKMDRQITTLRNEVEEKSKLSVKLLSELSDATNRTQQLEREFDELNVENEREERQVDARVRDCTNLEHELARFHDQNDHLMKEIRNMNGRMKDMEKELVREVFAMRGCVSSNERMEREFHHLELQMEEIEKENHAKKNYLEAFRKDIDKANRLLLKVPKTIEKLIESKVQDKEYLKKENQKRNNYIQDTKTYLFERKNLLNHISKLRKKATHNLNETLSSTFERDRASRKCRELRRQLEKNENQLWECDNTIEHMSRRGRELAQEDIKIDKRYNTVKRERDELNGALSVSTSSVEELKKKCEIMASFDATLRSKKIQLDKELYQLKQSNVRSEMECAKLNASIALLHADLFRIMDSREIFEFRIISQNMTLSFIKKQMLTNLKYFKKLLIQRNESAIRLAERDEELCAFIEKYSFNKKIEIRANLELDLIDKERNRLETIVQCEKSSMNYLRRRYLELKEMNEKMTKMRKELSHLNVLENKMSFNLETPDQQRCRVIEKPCGGNVRLPDRSPEELQQHLIQIELQLYEMELRLVEKDIVLNRTNKLVEIAEKQLEERRTENKNIYGSVTKTKGMIKTNNRRMMVTSAETKFAERECERLSVERHVLRERLSQAQERMRCGKSPFTPRGYGKPLSLQQHVELADMKNFPTPSYSVSPIGTIIKGARILSRVSLPKLSLPTNQQQPPQASNLYGLKLH